MRKDIQELLQANKTCVLATVSEGEPHCSLMSYATDDDCREIYMATHRDTKKYKNLIANPSVSLLIDTREARREAGKTQTKALTVTGVFQGGLQGKRKAVVHEALLQKHPDLKTFLADPAAEIVVIRVRALQLLDGITDAYFEQVS